jgi:hypothetical protein
MLAYLFIVVALAFRFIPALAIHVAPEMLSLMNFSPLGAALLFFGAKRPREEWAPVVCVALFADAILTTQVYHLPLRWDFFASLAYYVIALFIGRMLCQKTDAIRVAIASVSGSMVFFLTSNFVAWLALDMYTKDFTGLVSCYVNAIPFFRATFASDLLYSAAIFGTPALIAAMQRKRAVAAARAS